MVPGLTIFIKNVQQPPRSCRCYSYLRKTYHKYRRQGAGTRDSLYAARLKVASFRAAAICNWSDRLDIRFAQNGHFLARNLLETSQITGLGSLAVDYRLTRSL